MKSNERGPWKICTALVALFMSPAFGAQQVSPELQAILSKDVSGASDHPLIGRYEGSVLLAQSSKAFDEIVLATGPAEGKGYERDKQKYKATVTATGRVTRSIYIAPPGRSSLEVTQNFVDALIAKSFKQNNPSIRAFIVGHTDNKGTLDYNLDLSNRRAVAVAKALTSEHALDPKRIVARGLGPLAPVATNRSEEGRVKNRRVELVEQ
jgi:outer membrane protein OmpA-like peptidoglycan-associated protein